jgi:tetratricopeptide (TPR) repeat protein
MTPSHAVPVPARTRRWRVPPPLTRGGELLEGADILREMTGEAAVLVWKSLRSVTLWASASPREHAELFAEGAEQRRIAEILVTQLDAELIGPLRTFAEVLGSPAAVRREAVALACRQVAQWAQARELTATTLAFTQAAALVCPADAELAHEVGRLARSGGEHARAESWHRRAIMLGRQTGAWEPYARSYVGLGNLAVQRGNYPQARRCQIKAYRAAKRHALGEVMAMALHDLFTIAVESGEAANAQRYARQAFRAYGPTHSRIPYLAHDLAVLWIREGQFDQALPVLEALLPRFEAVEDRVLILANVARAAGGVGRKEAFETAWSGTENLLILPQTAARAAQALLNLSRGATGLGEWERAETAAQSALERASRRGEAQIVFEAESVLLSVQSHRAIAASTTAEEALPEDAQIVEDFLQALNTTGAGAF